jgi:hypothetical protein
LTATSAGKVILLTWSRLSSRWQEGSQRDALNQILLVEEP